MTSTTLTTLATVGDIERMALSGAKSGLFGMKTMEQAAALMLIAQADGLHPAQALRDYHIISGKPALRADAMLARFQTAGGTVNWIDYTDKKVSAVFKHPAGGAVTIEWNIEMAQRAGLLSRNPTWQSYPRQMLRARVISEGVRAVFPGVAVGVYTVEEMNDTTAPLSVGVTTAAEPIVADPVALVREAPDLDALKNRYRDGIKVARKQKDADMEARLTEAKDARKAELEAIPGEVVGEVES